MSWDVIILNCHGTPPVDITSLPDDYRFHPLGPANAVRRLISKALDGVDWSDPTWGIYMKDGVSYEFNTGDDDPIESIMVHVRGGGDAIAPLLQVAVPNNWSMLDCSAGEFVDLDDPSQESWIRFQAYRDQILKTFRNA